MGYFGNDDKYERFSDDGIAKNKIDSFKFLNNRRTTTTNSNDEINKKKSLSLVHTNSKQRKNRRKEMNERPT